MVIAPAAVTSSPPAVIAPLSWESVPAVPSDRRPVPRLIVPLTVRFELERKDASPPAVTLPSVPIRPRRSMVPEAFAVSVPTSIPSAPTLRLPPATVSEVAPPET